LLLCSFSLLKNADQKLDHPTAASIQIRPRLDRTQVVEELRGATAEDALHGSEKMRGTTQKSVVFIMVYHLQGDFGGYTPVQTHTQLRGTSPTVVDWKRVGVMVQGLGLSSATGPEPAAH
jgi:hypothetical protein